MGLFSKKIVVCEKCGSTYETRITIGANICDQCLKTENEMQKEVKGYVEYAERMLWKPYTVEQLEEISFHRNQILERYRLNDTISKEELKYVSDNYRNLSDNEAIAILEKAVNSAISSTLH